MELPLMQQDQQSMGEDFHDGSATTKLAEKAYANTLTLQREMDAVRAQAPAREQLAKEGSESEILRSELKSAIEQRDEALHRAEEIVGAYAALKEQLRQRGNEDNDDNLNGREGK